VPLLHICQFVGNDLKDLEFQIGVERCSFMERLL
jgi:hypothetical protein